MYTGLEINFLFRSQLATNWKILVARSYILVANFIQYISHIKHTFECYKNNHS